MVWFRLAFQTSHDTSVVNLLYCDHTTNLQQPLISPWCPVVLTETLLLTALHCTAGELVFAFLWGVYLLGQP